MKLNERWRSGISSHLLLAALVLFSAWASLRLGWTAFGRQIDQYAYDFLFRLEPPEPWQPSSIVLAIDEQTLAKYGGLIGMRQAMADGLEHLIDARPAAVAVDLILAEPGEPGADNRLEAAFAATRNLVLASDMQPDGRAWEEPIDRFRKHAAAVAQVHADLDKYDAVSRSLPFEKVAGRERRWALALEAFRISRGGTGAQILESPDDLTVGSVRIPTRIEDGRVMRIRYAPPGLIPVVSIVELVRNPALAARFTGKVVFVGVTAQTAVRDRWMTPYSNGVIMPGIEMNANAYETLARQMFIVDAPLVDVVAVCFLLAVAAGLAYSLTAGWVANLFTLAILAVSQLLPAFTFAHSMVWPWLPGTLAALITTALAAAWRHLLVRRELDHAEHEKTRYQSVMQFVTHEMRTPLTAIQGSSELISRYGSMPEAKRKQMAEMINAESKRLAKMISTFLSVERLSDEDIELKQEHFGLNALVESCVVRARALAESKRIEIEVLGIPPCELTGDRELMEYAIYNLLTNAVKYSDSGTHVTVYGEDNVSGWIRLSIQDQGIGMDKKEAARIFEKFYRTKTAEQSGEAGTGIGLSIVEQIVTRHGGSIEVESEPGVGSVFTLTLRVS